jgi:hypothetical protein
LPHVKARLAAAYLFDPMKTQWDGRWKNFKAALGTLAAQLRKNDYTVIPSY